MITNILIVFGIIFALQVVFFIYASINKTDKVTDLSYGLTFIIGALGAYILGFTEFSLINFLILLVVVVWGTRLSAYLFIRILKIGKDKRFDGIREVTLKFASFWVLQAFSVFIILLPVTYLLLLERTHNVAEFNIISFAGLLISLLGVVIEGFADKQKFDFKNNPANKGKWVDVGLWKYSRHPNYLGEIMMWSGVFIFVLPFLSGLGYLTIISPLYISFLLLFVSGVPTLEREYDKRYGGNKEYVAYKGRTGVVLPRL